MRRRLAVPILFGAVGCAVLVSLGVWQLKRLAWKEAMLAELAAKILAEPVALPARPAPDEHRYLPVSVRGELKDPTLRVLISQKRVGAGYRLISPMVLDGRKIMIDRGVIPVDAVPPALPVGQVEISGNLHWPDETDGFTPPPDLKGNIWFARDVARMAEVLETEPILLVARQTSFDGPEVSVLPVDGAHIPNDHLQYAITWFSLAILWFVMTIYFLWRIRRPMT